MALSKNLDSESESVDECLNRQKTGAHSSSGYEEVMYLKGIKLKE
jgi:hypothetical protein